MVSFIIVGIACIVFVVVEGQKINNDLQDGFLNSAKNDMLTIVNKGTKLFDLKLEKLTSNFINTMAFNAEESFRSEICKDNNP